MATKNGPHPKYPLAFMLLIKVILFFIKILRHFSRCFSKPIKDTRADNSNIFQIKYFLFTKIWSLTVISRHSLSSNSGLDTSNNDDNSTTDAILCIFWYHLYLKASCLAQEIELFHFYHLLSFIFRVSKHYSHVWCNNRGGEAYNWFDSPNKSK